MNLKELIAFYESKLENPDLTSGSRKVATLTLMELRRAERLNELVRAGDTMNRHNLPEGEPKTERVHLYMDDTETQQFFLGGHKFYELTIDKMIRHKWPEEKPDEGQYLVARRYKYGDGKLRFTLASYWFDQRYDAEVYSPESEGAEKWGYIKNPKKIEMCWMESSDDGCRDMSDEVVYWWNLPEVKE